MQQILLGIVKKMLKGKFVVLNYYEAENLKISEDRMMPANRAEEVAPRPVPLQKDWVIEQKLPESTGQTLRNSQRIYSNKANVDQEKAALKWQESFVAFLLDPAPLLPQINSSLEDSSTHFQFGTFTPGSRVMRADLIAKSFQPWSPWRMMQGICFVLPNWEFSQCSKVSL